VWLSDQSKIRIDQVVAPLDRQDLVCSPSSTRERAAPSRRIFSIGVTRGSAPFAAKKICKGVVGHLERGLRRSDFRGHRRVQRRMSRGEVCSARRRCVSARAASTLRKHVEQPVGDRLVGGLIGHGRPALRSCAIGVRQLERRRARRPVNNRTP